MLLILISLLKFGFCSVNGTEAMRSSINENTCSVSKNKLTHLFQDTCSYGILNTELCDLGRQYIENPSLLNALPKASDGSLPVYLANDFVIKNFEFRETEGLRLGMEETVSSRREKELDALRIIGENNLYRLVVPDSCLIDSYSINQRLKIQGHEESRLLYQTHPEKFSEAVRHFTHLMLESSLKDILSFIWGIPRFDNVVPYLVEEGEELVGQLGLVDLEHLEIGHPAGVDDIENLFKLFPYHFREILEVVEDFAFNELALDKSRNFLESVTDLAFTTAACFGEKEAIETLLLEKDISAKAKNKALAAAAARGHKEIVETLLLEKDISADTKRFVLCEAIIHESKELTKRLLSEKDISAKAKEQALVAAAGVKSENILERLLVEKDISPEAKEAALDVASILGHKEIVDRLLVEKDISAKAKEHALESASIEEHKEIVDRLLVEKDISPEAKEAALDAASILGHKEIADRLLVPEVK